MTDAIGARCARHPEVAGVEVCVRCGAFVCGDCLELEDERPYCPSCYAREVTQGPSLQAKAALLLSVGGLNCGFFPGLIGLVLAYRERAAIARGEAPAQGKKAARVALWVGWVNAVLLLIAGGAFVVWRALQR